jgi:hypothetical protein
MTSATATLDWPLLLALGAMAVLNTVLLVFSRVRLFERRGEEGPPHCVHCDYCLTGITSERCPECGAALTKDAICHGQRRLNKRGLLQVAVAVMFWLLFAYTLVDFVRPEGRCRRYPTSVLIDYVRSPKDPKMASAAWRVLMTRDVLGELKLDEKKRLIDVCLAAQAGQTPIPVRQQMIDFLGRSDTGRLMSADQRTVFYKQLLDIKLRVKSPVITGQPIRFEREHRVAIPSASPLWVRVTTLGVFLDGEQIDSDLKWDSPKSLGDRIEIAADCTAAGQFRCDKPGQHTLKMILQLGVHDQPPSMAQRDGRKYERQIQVETTFEVSSAPDDSSS